MIHYNEVAATCEKAGNQEYWECKKCNRRFTDSEGVIEYASGNESVTTIVLGKKVKKTFTKKIAGRKVKVKL